MENQQLCSSLVHQHPPFIIGVAGGTASGKSSVCSRIMEQLIRNGIGERVASISQDSFYRGLAEEDRAKAEKGDYNFDHPDSLDYPLMIHAITSLKERKPIQIPNYDFRTHSRLSNEFQSIDDADVILVEGILIFFDQRIREMFDLKLFVDADPDIRLARRVERDIRERGRPLDSVLHQYLTLVKPAYEEFCLPTKKYADVIIPRGAENDVAISLIVQHIQEILRTISHQQEEGHLMEGIPLQTPTPPIYGLCHSYFEISQDFERSKFTHLNLNGNHETNSERKLTRHH